jgi:two-component system sensor histidine kinase AlgZ
MCVLRGYIAHFNHRVVALISYITIVLVVCIVSEVAYWYVFRGAGSGTSHWQFVLRNALIAIILTGPILRYFYVQHQWRANVRAEAESRLQALQSRIRPHFFFNSMNTIASLTRSDPARAETAVEDLADLFRASMRDARQFHSMQQEWHLCERYLDIESLRLGERLKINWQVDDLPGDAFVPPLLIQPLLENAIYHGIERRTEGGTIHIHGDMRDNQITVSIRNPVADELSGRQGNQIAQQNIRDRLQTLYGQRGKMEVEINNQTYHVIVSWPYWNRLDEDTDH